MTKLRDLKGLGPKSEAMLHEIGIKTKEDLAKLGPIKAYLQLKELPQASSSLNFLYALVGALTDRHWLEIQSHEKEHLLYQLEEYEELKQVLADK